MEVVRALDAGPVVSMTELPISPFDTTGTLEPRLALAGARLLVEVLEPWADRRLVATPQDDALSTYAPMLKREDALLDWSRPAVELWRRVRAFNPWPVAYTTWQGAELRILDAWPLADDSGLAPGTVLAAAPLPAEARSNEAAFSVQTGDGRLAVVRLQRPGKRPLSGAEFLRGQRDFAGARL
jgi:methionyl-tRNA formyltransferase